MTTRARGPPRPGAIYARSPSTDEARSAAPTLASAALRIIHNEARLPLEESGFVIHAHGVPAPRASTQRPMEVIMNQLNIISSDLILANPRGAIHHVLNEGLSAGLLNADHAVAEPPSGYELPSADAYARRIAEEAEAWLDHARERSRMHEATLVSKAIHSVAFTMRHRAHDFAVPSKLSGTSKYQPALWALVKNHVALGARLDVVEMQGEKRPRLVVRYEGEELGEVQSKHVPWMRPLIPFGAGIWLTRITGHEERYMLGVNCCFGRIGRAVTALNHALGTNVGGDGHGGDGAPQTPAEAAHAEALPRPNHGGDGAPSADGNGVRDHLRLVSSGLPVAKPRLGTGTDINREDVVLYREIDGTARATVEHVVRHSPTGIEWGYGGSGPADLSRSILLAFTNEEAAERLYQRFKAEVVAAVPKAGGVIRAVDVRAWLAANQQ